MFCKEMWVVFEVLLEMFLIEMIWSCWVFFVLEVLIFNGSCDVVLG